MESFGFGGGGEAGVGAGAGETDVGDTGVTNGESGGELKGSGGSQWVGAEEAEVQLAHGGGGVDLVPSLGEF